MNVSKEPSVSIVIPTYNEADNIESVLGSFIASKYSNLVEILVIDGNSTDNTREKVIELARQSNKVKLLPNPLKIQSSALNIGLKASQGEIFLRADAHCQYAIDYVEQCVQTLLSTKAINVGGAQRFVAQFTFQAGVALAANSLLGSGGAKYRNPEYNGYADTVFLGCMWRKVLLELGGYGNQITNEDAELNQRLLAKNTEAIYINSEIKVWYLPRKTWYGLWIQYFKYGRGRFLTSSKHKNQQQLRGKLPFILIGSAISWLCLDILIPEINLYTLQFLLIGWVAILLESLRVNLKLNQNFVAEIWRNNKTPAPNLILRWLTCAIAIITMPMAHFSGYGYQLIKNKFLRISGW